MMSAKENLAPFGFILTQPSTRPQAAYERCYQHENAAVEKRDGLDRLACFFMATSGQSGCSFLPLEG